MKRLILFVSLLASTTAMAGAHIPCEIMKTPFNRVNWAANAVSFDSATSQPLLGGSLKMTLDVFGRTEQFSVRSASVWSATKLDFVLERNPLVRATLLVNKTPGEALDHGQFEGLLIFINAQDAGASGGPAYDLPDESLVLKIRCKTR